MRCTRPRTVGFYADGKTLCWSPRKYSKEYPTFQIPCTKCASCRLQQASEKALRCVLESSMYEYNSFITLTYSEENLKSAKLQYRDFQLFIKKLREHIAERNYNDPTSRIGVFAAGEYGDKNKRPHWHAIIFNWQPHDLKHHGISELGDDIFTSKSLDALWGKNDKSKAPCQIGAVTLKSAGYVARYALKKLTHGKDQEHDFHPIARSSSKHAIGKKWLEKFYWSDCFAQGHIRHDGKKFPIPRYFERWLQKNKPSEWRRYVTEIKPKIMKDAEYKESLITEKEKLEMFKDAAINGLQSARKTRNQVREMVLELKIKKLKEQKC